MKNKINNLYSVTGPTIGYLHYIARCLSNHSLRKCIFCVLMFLASIANNSRLANHMDFNLARVA